MSRRTWSKDSLHISYGNPVITAFKDGEQIKDMNEAMYFYYNINILQGNKIMFEARTHDFPKVQNLPAYIDHIMNFDMDKSFLLENYGDEDGFQRRIKYNQVTLEDSFGVDIEYFYKIERYDWFVKQISEEPKEWSEYVLTIGDMERSKKYGGANREDYGKCIMIKELTPEDMINLKNTALSFCEEAIKVYNKWCLEDQEEIEI